LVSDAAANTVIVPWTGVEDDAGPLPGEPDDDGDEVDEDGDDGDLVDDDPQPAARVASAARARAAAGRAGDGMNIRAPGSRGWVGGNGWTVLSPGRG